MIWTLTEFLFEGTIFLTKTVFRFGKFLYGSTTTAPELIEMQKIQSELQSLHHMIEDNDEKENGGIRFVYI